MNTFKKITGYVCSTLVIAYVYPGLDYGLSHYVIDGKTKMGTVKSIDIVDEEEAEY